MSLVDLEALTDQVLDRCKELARFSDDPDRLTRTFLQPSLSLVHRVLAGWMQEAGLQVRVDAIGNMIGRLPARDPRARVFLVGSHVDTVPDAGMYDGVLGVVMGLAAAQLLKNTYRQCALDVIAFSEEEGIRFRTPYLGSLAVTGRLTPDLLALTDAQGISVLQAIRNFGLNPEKLAEARYAPEQVKGFFEVHIEQGPVLEAQDRPLAVVSAIAGQSRRWLEFEGHAGHAGTLPMEYRRDALAAAAEWIGAVEQKAREIDGLRATVGAAEIRPGAVNVVPGLVRLSLDVRHGDDAIRESAVVHLLDDAREVAARRKLSVTVVSGSDQPAVGCSPELVHKLERPMEACGHSVCTMISGAGHDAAVMASLCPTAMLFVRSPGGISHHPNESVRPQDVRAALEVMVDFLRDVLGSS